jgi:hypothetical protein
MQRTLLPSTWRLRCKLVIITFTVATTRKKAEVGIPNRNKCRVEARGGHLHHKINEEERLPLCAHE